MLSAIIIDDQRINAEFLQKLVIQFCPSVAVIGTSTSIEDGYQQIRKHEPDLIFLDIELSRNSNGFDLLNMFKPASFRTIFVTAHAQYAVDAFRENALDYLLKPINIRDLQTAVTKAEEAIGKKKDEHIGAHLITDIKISLPTQDGYQFVHQEEVLYCEASGSYANVHFLDGRKMTISMNLKECESILPAKIFCRIHNSYIINITYATRYIKGRVGTVILTNSVQLEVSSSRKDSFLQRMRRI